MIPASRGARPGRRAAEDPRLSAVVVSRVPLEYEGGADPAEDRPAHVRAGSSLARVGLLLAVVQDDANFVALADPATGLARPVPLPRGEGGRRVFDEARGTKAFKLDLEACVAAPDWRAGTGSLLLLLGSGSTDRRDQVVLVRDPAGAEPAVEVLEIPELYARLRDARAFAGSELNVEGAVLLGGRLRLFGRGNGSSRGDLDPVNATCDLDWAELRAHLDGTGPAPEPRSIATYDLGWLDGCPLGFTDATRHGDRVLFLAAAEDSPDVVRDGEVVGSAVGVIGLDGARWTRLRDETGGSLALKLEGLELAPGPGLRLHAVVDADDPDRPSELLELELRGPWDA